MARHRHIVAYEWALAQPIFPTRLQMSEIMKTANLCQQKVIGVRRCWGELTGSATVALRQGPPEERCATKDRDYQRREIAGGLDLDVKVLSDVHKGGHDGGRRERCHHCVKSDQEQIRDLLLL